MTPEAVWTLICVLAGALLALIFVYVWMGRGGGGGEDLNIEPWVSPRPDVAPWYPPDEWVDAFHEGNEP